MRKVRFQPEDGQSFITDDDSDWEINGIWQHTFTDGGEFKSSTWTKLARKDKEVKQI